MSYTFVLESGVESSAEYFSDIPAELRSKLTPTGERSCFNANGTEYFQDSPFGTTLKHSTQSHGKGPSMLYAPGGHATTSVRREKCSESTVLKADFGSTSHGSLARFDQDSRSWKTHQRSLFSDFLEFSGTWPRWGTMLDGELLEEGPPAWIQTGRVSGYLRRPQAKDGHGFYKVSRASTEKRAANPERQIMLIHQLLLSAYPDMKDAVANPPFWESLMDLPIGWSDLKPLDKARFQAWLNSHGKPSVSESKS